MLIRLDSNDQGYCFLFFVLAILYDVEMASTATQNPGCYVAFCVTSVGECLHLELVLCSQLLHEQHALLLKLLVQTPKKFVRAYNPQF